MILNNVVTWRELTRTRLNKSVMRIGDFIRDYGYSDAKRACIRSNANGMWISVSNVDTAWRAQRVA